MPSPRKHEDVTNRWVFGAEPLPQTVRAASLLRRVTNLVVAVEDEEGAVERLIDDLEHAERELSELVPADLAPRVGAAASGEGRVYVDHAFAIGAHNPCFPEYDITVVDGGNAHGSVEFPIAYEGPPGIVHGGFLAVFFDCVVQHHNCEVGLAGKTTALTVRYRRPTPLLTRLDFTLERTAGDDRIHTSGTLSAAGKVVCEADVDAIAGIRGNLPEVSPRRTRP
jgi:hypothetical protein